MLKGTILSVVLTLETFVFFAPANAQTQPHVTVTITGPDVVYPGQEATFDVAIDVDGPSSDVYLTWSGAGSPIGPGGLCCEYLRSPLLSGSADVVGSQVGAIRLSVQGPRAVLQLVLELYDPQPAPQLAVSAYLPGSNVSQYETITGFKSIVASGLPQTGGLPGNESSPEDELAFGGLAMLALSGACYAIAFRRRTP